ncbi:MAG: hypothetical protein ACKN9V_04450 [Pseudomonadota bacterium]
MCDADLRVYSPLPTPTPTPLTSKYPECGGTLGCYDSAEAKAVGIAFFQDGSIEPNRTIIEYKIPEGGTFKVWKYQNSDRIINSTGLAAQSPQKKMLTSGNGFSSADFTFTKDAKNISGRACPTFVHIDNVNQKFVTDRCLYYTGMVSCSQKAFGCSENGLKYDNPSSGEGTKPSWFEYNVPTCSQHGMRLPTLFEVKSDWSEPKQIDTNGNTSGDINDKPGYWYKTWPWLKEPDTTKYKQYSGACLPEPLPKKPSGEDFIWSVDGQKGVPHEMGLHYRLSYPTATAGNQNNFANPKGTNWLFYSDIWVYGATGGSAPNWFKCVLP